MQNKDKSQHNIRSSPKNTQNVCYVRDKSKKGIRDIMVLKGWFKLGCRRLKEIGVSQGFVLAWTKKLSNGRGEFSPVRH